LATNPHQPTLADYWTGIHRSIDARLAALRNYLRHPASGTQIEDYFRSLLREYLPRRYAVESGFVVNAAGERSDHLDVIVADLHEIPPLCSEPLLKIYPAEAVVAAIEITAAPKSRVRRSGLGTIEKLEDDILKLARLRALARRREYIDSSPVGFLQGEELRAIYGGPRRVEVDLAPRAYVITCGDEWSRAATYQAHLDAALRSARQRGEGETWLNAALSIKHGLIWYRPHSDFVSERLREHGLLEFFLFLNQAIATYQTYRINITRYRPSVPEENGDTGGGSQRSP
jgi:hypothetical protein